MSTNAPYIIIVDDDPEDSEMLAKEFRVQNPGADVRRFLDGEQALGFLIGQGVQELPVMIIADYQMLHMGGAELLRLLHPHDKYRNITKIVWSTSCNRMHKDECLRCGANTYFVKPGDMNELARIVSDLTRLFKNAIAHTVTVIPNT